MKAFFSHLRGYLQRLCTWVWRAWPVLMLLPIGLVHWAALAYIPAADRPNVHKTIGVMLQVAGAGFILYSIDSNLFLLRGHRVWQLIAAWARSIPPWLLVVKVHVINLQGVGSAGAVGSVTVGTTGTLTVEQRLDALERRVSEVSASAHERDIALGQRLDRATEELAASVTKTAEGVDRLGLRMNEVAVGGFKQQIFGAALGIWGSIAGAVA